MSKRKTIFAVLILLIATLTLASPKTVILATTTSTDDTGLLDHIIPLFEKDTGYFVKVLAVGSGQAIVLGKRGEADVLLVHSPDDEKRFMQEGYGIRRRLVMHNDFVLVGPPSDPAGVKKAKDVAEALSLIYRKKALFISRGDNSGTDQLEKKLWKELRINPVGERWYQETGGGMGQTLNIASEKRGYTLTDRSTYLTLKKNLRLTILKEGDKKLKNIYHIIEVNPKLHRNINAVGGKAFADFIVSDKIQRIIGEFGKDRFGFSLFFPGAGKTENMLDN